MVTSRVNLKGVEIDIVGAAAVAGLLVVGYFLLLRGPLEDVRIGRDLEMKQQAAAISIQLVQKKYIDRLGKLEEGQRALAVQASWLRNPDLPDEVLGRISELAKQCDVRVIRWQPQGVQTFTEYQARSFSVDGAASWPALLRWLSLLEEGAPLLDVTNFTVGASTVPGDTACQFSCSLKLYQGRGAKTMEVAAVTK